MTNLGCTSPWGLNKDYICKNQTFGLQAHNLYKDYFSWKNGTRLDECLRTCNTMKLQTGNEQHEFQPYIKGLASARLEFRFFEMVTVTNEYYSYIWLNLLAEAGGYVGLFLGYSVFQITDVLDTLLTWSIFCLIFFALFWILLQINTLKLQVANEIKLILWSSNNCELSRSNRIQIVRFAVSLTIDLMYKQNNMKKKNIESFVIFLLCILFIIVTVVIRQSSWKNKTENQSQTSNGNQTTTGLQIIQLSTSTYNLQVCITK